MRTYLCTCVDMHISTSVREGIENSGESGRFTSAWGPVSGLASAPRSARAPRHESGARVGARQAEDDQIPSHGRLYSAKVWPSPACVAEPNPLLFQTSPDVDENSPT